MTTKEMLVGREGKWPLRYKICDHKEMQNNYRELSLIWRLLVGYYIKYTKYLQISLLIKWLINLMKTEWVKWLELSERETINPVW